MENWLQFNLHLNLKKEKTTLIYIISTKMKFLSFDIYGIPYNQLFYRNSKQIEKFKRIKTRILNYQKVTKKKHGKRLRLDILRIIKEKLKIKILPKRCRKG